MSWCVIEFVCRMMFSGRLMLMFSDLVSLMLFIVEWCRCWCVLLVFGNVVLAGVQSPILFILECCSMLEVGRV